ncbi:hypothetical protein SKZ59_24475 [Janthinobacterium sp. GMG2]|uniref:hypothetical protein n=1 Tax=Janthinobacterium sp. GMG2 TaxID=3096606 RepID=UPI0029F543C9|nr:hypothetical protein [Janthinobacterium sp. GMG2]MDX8124937.1 hypothetical protein [Janthinobacterium sp. GMG2]
MNFVTREINSKYFDGLVGEDVFGFIQENAPTKIISRIYKAIDHTEKAIKLAGLDDEMGTIRLIAAEEELVVAIFEWLKINEAKMPEHRDVVRMYKNHHAKLMFYPIISLMRYNISWIFGEGVMSRSSDKLFNARLTMSQNGAKMVFFDCNEKELISMNPLDIFLTREGDSNIDVIEELFNDLVEKVQEVHGVSLREFVSLRAEFRNKLLYAEDGGFITGGDDVVGLLKENFDSTYRTLLWCIAILLSNSPANPKLGIISQFISLYRRVLLHVKVMKSKDFVDLF